MESKVLLSVAVMFIMFQYAHSLRCYKCNARDPDRSCASPLDTSNVGVVSEECNKTTLYSNNPFEDSVDQILKTTDSSTDYQCIAYEKFYVSTNTTQTIRGCMQKYDDFCTILNHTAQVEKYYNLTRCHICHTEHCNSAADLHISALLGLFGLMFAGTVRNSM